MTTLDNGARYIVRHAAMMNLVKRIHPDLIKGWVNETFGRFCQKYKKKRIEKSETSRFYTHREGEKLKVAKLEIGNGIV